MEMKLQLPLLWQDQRISSGPIQKMVDVQLMEEVAINIASGLQEKLEKITMKILS